MNATAFGAPWGAALVGSSATVVLLVFATSAAVYFGPRLNRILYPEREVRGETWCRRLAVCILIVPLLTVGGTLVFGDGDAEPLLGVTALESGGFEVDPRTQQLKRLPAVLLKGLRKAVDSAWSPRQNERL